MDPLSLAITVAAVTAAACWIASLLTGDTSWIDRIWSVVPVAYAWIFAAGALVAHVDATRVVVMAVLISLWGARLTYNFARKGGYTGTEDYRWAVLRGRMTRMQFQAFNVVFICAFQSALLLAIVLPVRVAAEHPSPFNGADLLLAVLFLGCLGAEAAADQQQWAFHRRKHAAGGVLEPGFLTTGMFRFSRHPNFFFEQAQWWVIALFGLTAALSSGAPLGWWTLWDVLGAVLLTALFIGSTVFTESISASKYPAYRAYQRSTSMLVPWFSRAEHADATAPAAPDQTAR